MELSVEYCRFGDGSPHRLLPRDLCGPPASSCLLNPSSGTSNQSTHSQPPHPGTQSCLVPALWGYWGGIYKVNC